MDAKTFLAEFETVAEAPGGVAKLRELILQLAVQGKLVPQDPNDEPASVLLARIAAEKARLVKEGKLKKEKAFPSVNEEDILFEIPVGWQWSRLVQTCSLITDGEHSTPPRIDEEVVPLATAKNIRDGFVDLGQTDFVSYETAMKCWQRCHPEHNDLLSTLR